MRISDWSSDVCSSDLPSRSGRGTYGHFGSRPKAQAPRQDKIIVILWSTAVDAMFICSGRWGRDGIATVEHCPPISWPRLVWTATDGGGGRATPVNNKAHVLYCRDDNKA